jgi:hypothetical protein
VSLLWSIHADGSDPRRLVTGTAWGDWLSPSPTHDRPVATQPSRGLRGGVEPAGGTNVEPDRRRGRGVSLIARGGIGEVYLATQSFPERRVALKLLPHDLASDPAFRERFNRESNAAASVEHPAIVPFTGRRSRR